MTKCQPCRDRRRAGGPGSRVQCADCNARDVKRRYYLLIKPDALDVEAVLLGQVEPHRVGAVDRREVAKILLRRGEMSHSQIAQRSGMSERGVSRWSVRLQQQGEVIRRGRSS